MYMAQSRIHVEVFNLRWNIHIFILRAHLTLQTIKIQTYISSDRLTWFTQPEHMYPITENASHLCKVYRIGVTFFFFFTPTQRGYYWVNLSKIFFKSVTVFLRSHPLGNLNLLEVEIIDWASLEVTSVSTYQGCQLHPILCFYRLK